MGSVRVRIALRVALLVIALGLVTFGILLRFGLPWAMLTCGILVGLYTIAFVDDGRDSG